MKLRGIILAEHPDSVIFQLGSRKTPLPKSLIRRLLPNDYQPGPHTIYLPGWLAAKKGFIPARGPWLEED